MRSDSRKAKEKSSADVSNITEAKPDGSNTNIECSMRHNRSSQKNVEFVDEVIWEINDWVVATAIEYYCDIRKCVPIEVERLRNRIPKWINPDAYGKKFV